MNEIALSDDLKLLNNKINAFNKRGKFEYTDHENIFFSIFPHLERQVTFGTGSGGLEKWGTKKFTADFFDKENNVVYEIDGKSHARLYNQLVDELKKRFLLEKGIKTVRITNEQVMELAKKERERMKHFEESFNFFFWLFLTGCRD